MGKGGRVKIFRIIMLYLCAFTWLFATEPHNNTHKSDANGDSITSQNIIESADSINAMTSQNTASRAHSAPSLESSPDSINKDSKEPFIPLYSHNAVYILPFYHSFSTPAAGNADTEIKFQFSFKLALLKRIGNPAHKLYFAYTQRAWWQNYTPSDSRPFRDLDYEPEIFYSYERALRLFGGHIKAISFGYNHISNGERADRSRTQNRLLLNVRWEYDTKAYGSFGVKLGAWVYFGTHHDGFINDNSDLPLYRGYNDVQVYYKGKRHWFEAYMRPPIARRYYPYFELGYTLRISDNIGIYAQYINGFGDSIFEYNQRAERVGLGFRLWNP